MFCLQCVVHDLRPKRTDLSPCRSQLVGILALQTHDIVGRCAEYMCVKSRGNLVSTWPITDLISLQRLATSKEQQTQEQQRRQGEPTIV